MSEIDKNAENILNETNLNEEVEELHKPSIIIPTPSIYQIISKIVRIQFSWTCILLELLNIISNIIHFYEPFVEGHILNAITIERDFSSLMYWGKFRLFIIFGNMILDIVINKISKNLNTFGEFYKNYFHNILKKDMEFFDNYKPSEIKVIIQQDLNCVYKFELAELSYNLRFVFKFILSIISLLYISYELFIIQTINFLIEFYDMKDYDKIWDDLDKKRAKNVEIFEESLLNIKLLKCFSMEVKIFNLFQKSVEDLFKFKRSNWRNSNFRRVISLARIGHFSKTFCWKNDF